MPLYPLFGGAITVSLDGDYLDASDMRQVPDNQEVLLSRTTNVSVIVEVLQCAWRRTRALTACGRVCMTILTRSLMTTVHSIRK